MRLIAAAACSLAMAAHAVEPAQLAREIGVDPSKEVAQHTSFVADVVVAPIPISNPTVGTGLAVVVMPFYHLGEQSPLSNTAVALGYTSSGSWAVGAAQSTRLRGDDLRVDGFLAYINLRYPFYGIGASAGEKGVGIPIEQKAFAFAPELVFKVAPGLFLGARYRGVRVDTSLDTADVPGLGPLPEIPSSVASSGLGPVALLDTRDHEMSPSSGWLADLRANFAEHSLGSDGSYRTFSASANHYRRLGPGVIALRAYACGASDRTPLFDLCLFGAGNDLRGYEIGRYRDRAMFAAQGEYRFPLAGRFGAVAFAGVGKVAASFDEMGGEPALPSIGAGLRWLASAKARVNLSLDVAKGRDDTSIYVYVKEAF